MEMQERAEQQVYGKYGTLAKKYLEEHNVGKLWAIENLSEYLHGIDRQADELYETMYAKLSQDERYKRTGQFMEDYHRQTAMQKLIEDEILNELVYVQWGGVGYESYKSGREGAVPCCGGNRGVYYELYRRYNLRNYARLRSYYEEKRRYPSEDCATEV